jgi:hypothetical protein
MRAAAWAASTNMNQLHALAMNEGYRWKKKLFSEKGRVVLKKLSLAPWTSRRRQELLELLDRMDPIKKRNNELPCLLMCPSRCLRALEFSHGMIPTYVPICLPH